MLIAAFSPAFIDPSKYGYSDKKSSEIIPTQQV